MVGWSLSLWGILVSVTLLSWMTDARGQQGLPFIMTTWNHGINATTRAWEILESGGSPVDAVVESIAETCELTFCGLSVGPYGVIDERGEHTQDAMIMDGPTHRAAGVAGLRRVRSAIGVARAVFDYTTHTLLSGDLATEFAAQMGFTVEDLSNEDAQQRFDNWNNNDCQPNFRQNVSPDPTQNCGPYTPLAVDRHNESPSRDAIQDSLVVKDPSFRLSDPGFHPGDPTFTPASTMDTICQIIVTDAPTPHLVVGTSTNGLSHKVPGRVGDTPIPGSGGYVDNDVGAAAATGNGDIMMRFVPSYQAVESMRRGMSPQEAARDAILRIIKHYPDFSGAVMAANTRGEYGAACNLRSFEYAIRSTETGETKSKVVDCEESLSD